MDRLDEARGRELLKDESDEVLDRAATVLMRLMFLLCAEWKLLPVEESEAYSDCYAASTLLNQLETEASEHGEEIFERRYDAGVKIACHCSLGPRGQPYSRVADDRLWRQSLLIQACTHF